MFLQFRLLDTNVTKNPWINSSKKVQKSSKTDFENRGNLNLGGKTVKKPFLPLLFTLLRTVYTSNHFKPL